jgi:hypothetical protein
MRDDTTRDQAKEEFREALADFIGSWSVRVAAEERISRRVLQVSFLPEGRKLRLASGEAPIPWSTIGWSIAANAAWDLLKWAANHIYTVVPAQPPDLGGGGTVPDANLPSGGTAPPSTAGGEPTGGGEPVGGDGTVFGFHGELSGDDIILIAPGVGLVWNPETQSWEVVVMTFGGSGPGDDDD